MKFFQMTLSKWLLALMVVSLAFLCGQYSGARHSTMIEMESNRNTLFQNISILKFCTTIICNEKMQSTVIANNDVALQRYVVLEASIEDFQGRIFWYAIWPVMNLIYTNPQKSNSIVTIRESYLKMGCGLNGVICTQNIRSVN
jgi:hypothetical protein